MLAYGYMVGSVRQVFPSLAPIRRHLGSSTRAVTLFGCGGSGIGNNGHRWQRFLYRHQRRFYQHRHQHLGQKGVTTSVAATAATAAAAAALVTTTTVASSEAASENSNNANVIACEASKIDDTCKTTTASKEHEDNENNNKNNKKKNKNKKEDDATNAQDKTATMSEASAMIRKRRGLERTPSPVSPYPHDPAEFFTRFLDCDGIPVRGHAEVHAEALNEACTRIRRILQHQPRARQNILTLGGELHIIGRNQVTSDLPEHRHMRGVRGSYSQDCDVTVDERTRGLGGLFTSCGEENLLDMETDPWYPNRDICTHEFSHALVSFAVVVVVVVVCFLCFRFGVLFTVFS